MAQPQEIDFFEPQILSNPFPFYEEAFEKYPVIKIPGQNLYCVFSNALVKEVLGRVDDFGNNFADFMEGRRPNDSEIKAVMSKGWPFVDTLLTADPPVHAHFRKLVNMAFSKPRVDAIESSMRVTAKQLLDRVASSGKCDYVKEFAVPFPIKVISGEIGLLEVEKEKVKRWSDALVDRFGGLMTKERELECAREVVEFQHVMMDLIGKRRQRAEDDLLSDLVSAQVAGERPLSDVELLSILQQLMAAGNETSTVALTRGLLMLIDNPSAQSAVRNDHSLIGKMVEEMLRLQAPAQALLRKTNHATRLGNFDLPANAMIQVRVGAANRDPAAYVRPSFFDVSRKDAHTHLSFGRGIHACVGSTLSRRELVVGFQCILERLDEIKVADGFKIEFTPNMGTPSLNSLPIEFAAAGQ